MSVKLTVDAIARYQDKIVLVERRKYPLGLALPGGHVELGESTEEAIARELKEETDLVAIDLAQFNTYSDPERDPRGPAISTVYICETYGDPRAGDDAKDIRLISLDEIDALQAKFAFDHYKILCDYRRHIRRKPL